MLSYLPLIFYFLFQLRWLYNHWCCMVISTVRCSIYLTPPRDPSIQPNPLTTSVLDIVYFDGVEALRYDKAKSMILIIQYTLITFDPPEWFRPLSSSHEMPVELFQYFVRNIPNLSDVVIVIVIMFVHKDDVHHHHHIHHHDHCRRPFLPRRLVHMWRGGSGS